VAPSCSPVPIAGVRATGKANSASSALAARPPIWWDPDPPSPVRVQESGRSRRAKHISETAGHDPDGTFWISLDDPLFTANHYVHEIVSLADSPLLCARCDGILQPGAVSWYAYNEERDFGAVCHECGENYGLNTGLPAER